MSHFEVNTNCFYSNTIKCLTRDDPTGIALNNAQTIAYITNEDADGSSAPGVSVCQIDPATELFSACELFTNPDGTAFNHPNGIELNNAGSIAYIANYGTGGTNSSIVQCPILANGNLDTCINAVTDDSIALTEGATHLVLNNAGTKVYVVLFNANQVDICTVNPANGSFSGCVDADAVGANLFNNPNGIALNTAENRVYVTNYNDSTVIECTINRSTGLFSACTTTLTNPDDGIDSPSFITLF